MAQPRKLSKAPAIEAVIDFRVKLEKVDPQRLEVLREACARRYPRWEPRRILKGGFELVEGRSASENVEEALHGFVCRSEDGLEVVQIKIDGLTVSRLAPYTSWERVFSEAKSLWQSYRDKMAPEAVTRLGVRFVNRLELPSHSRSLQEYLTAPPQVPEGWPSRIRGFLTRVELEDEEGLSATVTQALEKTVTPERVPIILDIDAYKTGEFTDDERMYEILEKLRALKNRMFFSSLTDRGVELYT